MDKKTTHHNQHQSRDFTPDPVYTNRWLKFKKNFFKKPDQRRLIILVSAGSILIVLAGMGWFWKRSQKPEQILEPKIVQQKKEEPKVVDNRVISPLTGQLVAPELAQRRVTAVMIENSIDARPQSGLEEAGVVFEAIAEGGITRFMALYQEQLPKNVGPIRSARPYYVQWARGFDAAYVHSGGSKEAIRLIPRIGIKDLDHGRYGTVLAERVDWRFSPHNVYSSMTKIDKIAKKNNFTKSVFTPFKYYREEQAKDPAKNQTSAEENNDTKKSKIPVGPSASKIKIFISGANYNSEYKYDQETKRYPRFMAQRPHTDKDSNKQISPRNIVVLETNYGIHPDHIHSVYKTVGGGRITVFRDGQVFKGKWRKSSKTAMLELLNKDGEAMVLAPGQTWIVVTQPGRLEYK